MKTPTKQRIQQRENKNVPTEENTKKRKMVFEFDVNSDSSESADLLVNTLQIISIYYLFILLFLYVFIHVCVHNIYQFYPEIQYISTIIEPFAFTAF